MADTKDGPELHPTTLELAQGKNYAAISSLLPSGQIQTQIIWVGTDGKRLYVNTETHRAKYKNVERDSRVTLCIRDEANPYRYAEVRGRVVETRNGDDGAGVPRGAAVRATGACDSEDEHDDRRADRGPRP